jgi:hypothetical protein
MSGRADSSSSLDADSARFAAVIDQFADQNGASLRHHSERTPLLVVFLRHGGCPFCRETLAHLKAARSEITKSGIGIALVHLMTDVEAANLFAKYDLADVPRYSAPDGRLYAAFGLQRGAIGRVAGPRVWWRGLSATLRGHLPGVPKGDIFQLPGTFLLCDGEIRQADRAETSAGLVDFVEFIGTGTSPGSTDGHS